MVPLKPTQNETCRSTPSTNPHTITIRNSQKNERFGASLPTFPERGQAQPKRGQGTRWAHQRSSRPTPAGGGRQACPGLAGGGVTRRPGLLAGLWDCEGGKERLSACGWLCNSVRLPAKGTGKSFDKSVTESSPNNAPVGNLWGEL